MSNSLVELVLEALEESYFENLEKNPMNFYQSLEDLLPKVNSKLKMKGAKQLTLKELETIVDKLHEKYWMRGFYRHPKTSGFPTLIEFTRRIKTKPKKPSKMLVLKVLEQEYLKEALNDGKPASIEKVFKRVNKQLGSIGFEKLSQKEFGKIIGELEKQGLIHVVQNKLIIQRALRKASGSLEAVHT